MTSRKTGIAYGFLQTSSKAERIKQAFHNMKADPEVMVPQNLVLAVGFSHTAPIDASFHGLGEPTRIFGVSDSDDLGQLLRISVEMGKKGANCVVRVHLPDATHEKAAGELGHVFNLMYGCTEIMGDAEKPVADIYFKNEAGIYVSVLPTQAQ